MSYINPDIVLLSNPIGVNAVIQSLQQDLYASLPWLEKAFGRAYDQADDDQNEPQVKRIPAVYVGLGEYHNVLPNDNIKSQSYFMCRGKEVYTTGTSEGVQRDISLIFWLNLKLISNVDDPTIELLRWEVERVLIANVFMPQITGVYDEKPEDVFLGYVKVDKKNNDYLTYPYAGFRIDMTVSYPAHTLCVPWQTNFSPVYISDYDLEFTIGDPGAPAVGATTFQRNEWIGKKIRLSRFGLVQYQKNIDNRAYYAFTSSTGTLTVFPGFQEGETFKVEDYGYA